MLVTQRDVQRKNEAAAAPRSPSFRSPHSVYKYTYTQARVHTHSAGCCSPTHHCTWVNQFPGGPLKDEVLPKRGWWFPCWQPSPLPASTSLLLKSTDLTRANSAKQTALLVTAAPWKHFLSLGSRVKTGEGRISGLASAARALGPHPPPLATCPTPHLVIFDWSLGAEQEFDTPLSEHPQSLQCLEAFPTPQGWGPLSLLPNSPHLSKVTVLSLGKGPHPSWASWLLGKEIL